MTALWLSEDTRLSPGETKFLLEVLSPRPPSQSWLLRDIPAWTPRSRAEILFGKGVYYHDTPVRAHGLVEVVKVLKNERILVDILDGQRLRDALLAIGYPDIARKVKNA